MNILLLATLGGYMVHAVFVHWRQGPEPEEAESHLHRGMPMPVMPFVLFFAYQILATPTLVAWATAPQILLVCGLFFFWLLLRQVRKKAQDGEEMSFAARCFYVVGGLFQTVLLGLSCYAAYSQGVLGRSLFAPEWVILGVIAGHGIFAVSLCFSHRSLDSLLGIGRYCVDIRPLARFGAKAPQQIFACLDVSFMEELIYRVAVQGALIALTGSPGMAIVIVAVVFSVVHRHFFYNHVVDSIEFLAFSLLLGALYYWTGSLMLVVMIHTVRNFEIVYFDHAESPLPTGGATATGVKA